MELAVNAHRRSNYIEKVKNFAKKVVGADKDPDVNVISTAEYVKSQKFDVIHFIKDYVTRLFPILGWITKYNLGWLSGDLIAGMRSSSIPRTFS